MTAETLAALEKGKAATLRCFAELWGQGDLGVAGEIVSDAYVCHAPGDRHLAGAAALRRYVQGYRTGFPGLRITILGQLGERDLVVTEFTMTGVHTGRWAGVPATGREVALGCVAFSRLTPGGLISEQWYEWERRKLLEQLGLVPILAG
ncbi:ester cyclase [Streptosporangiaceae bacterium NEAU-GS5]|nr:ester cyclase [Streptosporangiaceae bacterium NEAU-GS5]